MLVDSNTINHFNPFVVGDMSLPGTYNDPYEYSEGSVVDTMVRNDFEEPLSNICDVARTAGDGTVNWCNGKGKKFNKCGNKPFYPQRFIDPGFTGYSCNGVGSPNSSKWDLFENFIKPNIILLGLLLTLFILLLARK